MTYSFNKFANQTSRAFSKGGQITKAFSKGGAIATGVRKIGNTITKGVAPLIQNTGILADAVGAGLVASGVGVPLGAGLIAYGLNSGKIANQVANVGKGVKGLANPKPLQIQASKPVEPNVNPVFE